MLPLPMMHLNILDMELQYRDLSAPPLLALQEPPPPVLTSGADSTHSTGMLYCNNVTFLQKLQGF